MAEITYPDDGSTHTFTAAVSETISIELQGGTGAQGQDAGSAAGAGALGDQVEITYDVSEGEDLTIHTTGPRPDQPDGGFGGGGSGSQGFDNGSSGGDGVFEDFLESGGGGGGGGSAAVQDGGGSLIVECGGGGGGGGGGGTDPQDNDYAGGDGGDGGGSNGEGGSGGAGGTNENDPGDAGDTGDRTIHQGSFVSNATSVNQGEVRIFNFTEVAPTTIDATDVVSATIDGTAVTEVTIDGDATGI